MKKMLLGMMSLAAIAAMTSCSNEETEAQKISASAMSDALYIRPLINGNMRVINDYTTTSLNADGQEFRIIGTGKFVKLAENGDPITNQSVNNGTDIVTAFDDVLTYDAGSTYGWNFSTAVVGPNEGLYWKDKSTKGTFHAVAPKDVTEGDYQVKGGTTTQGYAAAADCRNTQEDVIVAYNEGVKQDFTNGVPINFQHTLSRIQFKAVNKDYTNGMFVQIQGMKLVNIASKGNLSFPNVVTTADAFSWDKYTPWATAAAPQWFYGKAAALTSINATVVDVISGDDFYMLPQQLVAADSASLNGDGTVKQYAAFRIKVFYTSDDAAASVRRSANNLKNIWPYMKVNEAFTSTQEGVAHEFAEGKFVNKDVYDKLTAEEQGKCVACNPADNEFAWALVPIDTKWEPGKKYIYTLNFSAGGVGITDPEDSAIPGWDIIPQSPVRLWFTVTVQDWDEVSETQNL